MPQVKILAPAKDYDGIVRNQSDTRVNNIDEYTGRRVKRATRIGQRVVVHLVGAAPGELLVFESPEDYERAIRREFVTS